MTEKKVPEWIDESDNNFWLSEVNLLYDNVVESIQRTRNKVDRLDSFESPSQ